jgi:hypothetical protein
MGHTFQIFKTTFFSVTSNPPQPTDTDVGENTKLSVAGENFERCHSEELWIILCALRSSVMLVKHLIPLQRCAQPI